MLFSVKKIFCFIAAVVFSLQISAGDLSFAKELKALKNWEKKKVSPDTRVTLEKEPGIRLRDNGSLRKNIELEPGARYRLTFYVKGQDLESGKNKGTLLMLTGNKKWQRITASPGKKLDNGTFDWRKGEGIIDCKWFGTGKIRLIAAVRGKGTAWYSKFSLKKLPPEKAAPKQKISFNAELFPANLQKGRLSFCENQLTPVLLLPKGKEKYTAQSAEMVIIAPEFLELVSVCETLTRKNGNGRVPAEISRSKVLRNGIACNRYTVTLGRHFVLWLNASWYRHILYFKARPGSSGRKANIFWSLQIGKEKQAERSVAVNILDPIKLPAAPCKEFGLWLMTTQGAFVPGLREEALKLWSDLTEKRYRKYSRAIDKHIPFPGYQAFCAFGGNSFIYDHKEAAKLLKKIPLDVDDKGRVRPRHASVWALVDDPEGHYEKYLRNILRRVQKDFGKITHLWWDFEPHPYGYDEGGRKRFARKMGLKKVPSIAEINKKYANVYFNYMVKLHAELVAKNVRIIREEIPGVTFWYCSDNLHAKQPHVSRWCGIDVSLSDDIVDIHNHMPYYTGARYFDDMAYNVRMLKKPYFPLLNPGDRVKSFFDQYSAPAILQNIVATAALGGIGIGFWPDEVMPGEYYAAIAEGFSKVSSAEDFYRKGKRCDTKFKVLPRNAVSRSLPGGGVITFPDFSATLRYTVHKLGSRYLTTVFNYDPKRTLIAEVSGPGIKPFLVKVPPQGCTLAGPGRLQDQKLLRKEIARFSGGSALFRDHVKGKTRVFWNSHTSGSPVLEMTDGVITGAVDALGKCELVSLRVNGQNELYHNGSSGEIAFADHLQMPLNFKRTAHGITSKGIPYVTAEAVVGPYAGANPIPNPLYGMKIKRRIELRGHKIVMLHEFVNPSAAAMPLKLRLKNFAWPGYRFKADKVTVDGKDFSNEAFFRKPEWKGGKVELRAGNGVLSESVIFEPDAKFTGVFSWVARKPFIRKTVEFIVDQTLLPGKSVKYRWTIAPGK